MTTKTPITINDKDYEFEDLTPEQQTLFRHVVDLDTKLNATRFQLDQFQVSRDAFMSLLTQSLSA